jgi:predicted DNA binding CopG/RHH family protein
MRNAPLIEAGRGTRTPDLHFGKTEIFFPKGLDKRAEYGIANVACRTFKTDKQAEDFVATADLTDYDLSGGEVVRFELKRKDKSVNLRLPAQLLEAVQNRAKRVGVPYQRFIRMALERALHDPK